VNLIAPIVLLWYSWKLYISLGFLIDYTEPDNITAHALWYCHADSHCHVTLSQLHRISPVSIKAGSRKNRHRIQQFDNAWLHGYLQVAMPIEFGSVLGNKLFTWCNVSSHALWCHESRLSRYQRMLISRCSRTCEEWACARWSMWGLHCPQWQQWLHFSESAAALSQCRRKTQHIVSRMWLYLLSIDQL